jgi:hypothetical protein
MKALKFIFLLACLASCDEGPDIVIQDFIYKGNLQYRDTLTNEIIKDANIKAVLKPINVDTPLPNGFQNTSIGPSFEFGGIPFGEYVLSFTFTDSISKVRYVKEDTIIFMDCKPTPRDSIMNSNYCNFNFMKRSDTTYFYDDNRVIHDDYELELEQKNSIYLNVTNSINNPVNNLKVYLFNDPKLYSSNLDSLSGAGAIDSVITNSFGNAIFYDVPINESDKTDGDSCCESNKFYLLARKVVGKVTLKTEDTLQLCKVKIHSASLKLK